VFSASPLRKIHRNVTIIKCYSELDYISENFVTASLIFN